MNRVAKFEKVSYEQFEKDWLNTFKNGIFRDCRHFTIQQVKTIYDNIKLPCRATTGSAGYDFFSPVIFILKVN